ncbi:hypothetical protein K5X82_06115 [Halosquirtibacter xylanolyticus]|uniref:hypothetical protein n=1 Tax=Halosquirtibacter xylanolyticus TaxID=3374599 RepID=UPI0037494960|nr:hypothetical protein K5X82_06115 [Prolixibacteraceae bacterium]
MIRVILSFYIMMALNVNECLAFHSDHKSNIKDEFIVLSLNNEFLNSSLQSTDQSKNILANLIELEFNYPLIFNQNRSFIIQGASINQLSISVLQDVEISNLWFASYKLAYLQLLRNKFYIYGEILPYMSSSTQLKPNIENLRHQSSVLFGKRLSSHLNVGIGYIYAMRYEKKFNSLLMIIDAQINNVQLYFRYPDYAFITHAPSTRWRYGIEGNMPFLNYSVQQHFKNELSSYLRYQRYKISGFVRKKILDNTYLKVNTGCMNTELCYKNASHTDIKTLDLNHTFFFQIQLLYLKQ